MHVLWGIHNFNAAVFCILFRRSGTSHGREASLGQMSVGDRLPLRDVGFFSGKSL